MSRVPSILLAALVGVAATSCLNTPTVPVPPPMDATKLFPLSEPDDNGLVHVSAGANAFPPWDEVYRVRVVVSNLDDPGTSVEEYVNPDGSFDVTIFAESGDELCIRGLYPYGGITEASCRPVP
jgi:hypothetical protein